MWNKLNIIIPLSGEGSRFKEAGFTVSKPLVPVLGRPMIQVVLDNLNLPGRFVFIIREDAPDKDEIERVLVANRPDCTVLYTDGLTQGAACTCLIAKQLIDNSQKLVIVNGDQIMRWNPNDFYEWVKSNPQIDGALCTFLSDSPKNSYAKVEGWKITEVREKDPFSYFATTGLHYFARGSDFVWAAEEMIRKGLKVNGEYYVCPTYQQLIAAGKLIVPYHINVHYPIGTPEDLAHFEQTYGKFISFESR